MHIPDNFFMIIIPVSHKIMWLPIIWTKSLCSCMHLSSPKPSYHLQMTKLFVKLYDYPHCKILSYMITGHSLICKLLKLYDHLKFSVNIHYMITQSSVYLIVNIYTTHNEHFHVLLYMTCKYFCIHINVIICILTIVHSSTDAAILCLIACHLLS